MSVSKVRVCHHKLSWYSNLPYLPYLSDMPPRHIQSADEVLWHESIEHGHHMGDSIAYKSDDDDDDDDDESDDDDMMMMTMM